MRFVLSHASSDVPQILKDKHIYSSKKTGKSQLGAVRKFIYFELLSNNIPRTASGIPIYFSIQLLKDYQGYFNEYWDSSNKPSKEYPINRNNVFNSLKQYESIILKKDICDTYSGNQIFIEIDAIPIFKYIVAVGDPTFPDYHFYQLFCAEDKNEEGYYHYFAKKQISKDAKKLIRKRLPKKFRIVRSGFSIF